MGIPTRALRPGSSGAEPEALSESPDYWANRDACCSSPRLADWTKSCFVKFFVMAWDCVMMLIALKFVNCSMVTLAHIKKALAFVPILQGGCPKVSLKILDISLKPHFRVPLTCADKQRPLQGSSFETRIPPRPSICATPHTTPQNWAPSHLAPPQNLSLVDCGFICYFSFAINQRYIISHGNNEKAPILGL